MSDLSLLQITPALSADLCLKCNICTVACPVAPLTDLFPGPKYVGPQANRFRAVGQPSPDRGSVDYCNGCGVCSVVCPHGVQVAEINAQARASYHAVNGLPLRNRLLGRPELIGKLGTLVAPLSNYLVSFRPLRWLVEAMVGIDRRAPLPRFAGQQFRRWHAGRSRARSGGRKVLYFHGCNVNYYEPHIGYAAIAVLERNGCEVTLGQQSCCGLAAQSNGDLDTARELARGNLARLASYVKEGYAIVGTSTSCTLAMKHYYGAVMGLSGASVNALAEQTYDIFEFLWDLYLQGELDTNFQRIESQIAYHPPCQLNSHGMGHPATRLLALISGLEIVESGEACCGVGGTYGLKRGKYDIAQRVGQPVFDALRAVPGEVALCDSETCRWWLGQQTRQRMLHPIELLAQAYGLL